jgi:hypothetical protein
MHMTTRWLAAVMVVVALGTTVVLAHKVTFKGTVGDEVAVTVDHDTDETLALSVKVDVKK